MAKNIESYDLKQDMRDDLMECYREVAPTCVTQFGAWRKTVLHPAKRYYITPKQAAQNISKYLHGDHSAIDKLKKNRREMYYSLIEEVKRLMASPEHHDKTLRALCRIAVNKPAPRFFISPLYMALIFNRIKHARYNADGQLIQLYPSQTKEYRDTHYNKKPKNKQP